VGDIDFLVISAAENSKIFPKTRFWDEKSVENVVTFEALPINSSCSNNLIHMLQNNVHMLSFPIL
jgi:hypothetical protein